MKVTTVTLDFWGTLLVDLPSSDDRYRRRRLDDFHAILGTAGFSVPRATLEAGYETSGAYLGRIWRDCRDVPVEEHVAVILSAADPELPRALSPDVMAELVQAYASPALLVPPSVDPGAKAALAALAARGYTLAVVSNTMRTPGAVLRSLLDRYGLLAFFKHVTFSDEVGVRKPAAEIFALSLSAIGADAATAIHVGDDPILDVAGARGVGMRAIYLEAAAGRPAPRAADAVIGALADLPAAVAGLDVG